LILLLLHLLLSNFKLHQKSNHPHPQMAFINTRIYKKVSEIVISGPLPVHYINLQNKIVIRKSNISALPPYLVLFQQSLTINSVLYFLLVAITSFSTTTLKNPLVVLNLT
jgi:hypothetical protein